MEPAFKVEWIGRRVADPLLVTIGVCTPETCYQCVSLMKQYIKEDYGLDVPYPGNAIDWWYNTNSTILTKFYRVESSEAIQGDIVILHTLNHNDSTEPGHITIATGNINATQYEALEQNGATGGGTGLGGDAIRTRWIDRSRVAGILRPTMSPVVSTVPVCTYEVTVPRNLIVTRDPTNWYNLNGDEPVVITTLPVNTTFAVAGIAHHKSGHDFYMAPPDYAKAIAGDFSENNGISTDDLEEVPPPKPYVPPAAPLPYTPATTYTLVTDVPGFTKALDAINDLNAVKQIKAGTYTVYGDKASGQIPLLVDSSTNPKLILWVNPSQNIQEEPQNVPIITSPSPVVATTPSLPASPTTTVTVTPKLNPTQWRETYKAYKKPVPYLPIDELEVADIAEQQPDIHIPYDYKFMVYGWFIGPDNIKYFRVKPKRDVVFATWYGIPMVNPKTGLSYIEPANIWEYIPEPARKYLSLALGEVGKTWDNVFKRNKT